MTKSTGSIQKLGDVVAGRDVVSQIGEIENHQHNNYYGLFSGIVSEDWRINTALAAILATTSYGIYYLYRTKKEEKLNNLIKEQLKKHYSNYLKISLLIEDDSIAIENYINPLITDYKQQTDKEKPSQKKNNEFSNDKESLSAELIADEQLAYSEKIHCFSNSEFEDRAIINFNDLFGELAQKILIVGRPGIGKSIMCQYLATEWQAGRLWGGKFDAVFWLRLPGLLGSSNDLAEAIRNQCLEATEPEKPSLSEIKHWLITHKDRILFILDGYDEIIEPLKKPEYNPLKNLIHDVLNYKNVILTSRPAEFSIITEKHVTFNRILENIGFNDKSITSYVKKYMSHRNKPDLAQSLLSWLNQNQHIKGMAYIPIQLELLCSIWADGREDKIKNTVNVTDVYHDIIEKLWRRYKDRARGKEPSAQLKNIVAKIAYKATDEGLPIHIPAKELKKIKIIEEDPALHDEVLRTSFFKPLDIVNPRDLKDSSVYFLHLTFREYFAAWYFVNTQKNLSSFINEFKGERLHKWANTLPFIVGLLNKKRQGDKLIEAFDKLRECIQNALPGKDLEQLVAVTIACLGNVYPPSSTFVENQKIINLLQILANSASQIIGSKELNARVNHILESETLITFISQNPKLLENNLLINDVWNLGNLLANIHNQVTGEPERAIQIIENICLPIAKKQDDLYKMLLSYNELYDPKINAKSKEYEGEYKNIIWMLLNQSKHPVEAYNAGLNISYALTRLRQFDEAHKEHIKLLEYSSNLAFYIYRYADIFYGLNKKHAATLCCYTALRGSLHQPEIPLDIRDKGLTELNELVKDKPVLNKIIDIIKRITLHNETISNFKVETYSGRYWCKLGECLQAINRVGEAHNALEKAMNCYLYGSTVNGIKPIRQKTTTSYLRYLGDFGANLIALYEKSKNKEYLNQTINAIEEAISVEKSTYSFTYVTQLNNLAIANYLKGDKNRAIELYKEANIQIEALEKRAKTDFSAHYKEIINQNVKIIKTNGEAKDCSLKLLLNLLLMDSGFSVKASSKYLNANISISNNPNLLIHQRDKKPKDDIDSSNIENKEQSQNLCTN
jgi:hypothetical protein